MAYWHRARAKRITPQIRAWYTEGTGPVAVAGYKAGMSRVLIIADKETPFAGQEVSTPVTVLEVPPLYAYAIVAYRPTHFGLKKVAEIPALNSPSNSSGHSPQPKKLRELKNSTCLSKRPACSSG